MFAEPMLGKYQIIAEIARGGMGVVYLAVVLGPGGFSKLVVIKELKAELADDPSYLTMFLDEARLAARLNHPNIVQTNEVGEEGERHFMVMEYLDGRTYERIRRRSKRPDAASFTLMMQLHVMCDVLGALDYAHKLADFDGTPLRVVHRDISPNNVFITFDGHVKVLDFGIAKAADHAHETQAGAIKGKLSYMAPEQARGEKVDARADLFSVGVMLWEAVAGTRLRTGSTDEIVKVVRGDEVPNVKTVAPDVAEDLARIIAKATAAKRDDRYATASEMQRELEAFLISYGTSTSARDLGTIVTALFTDERARVTTLIDQYVTRARSGAAATRELPVLEISGGAPLNTPVPGSTNTGATSDRGTSSVRRSEGGPPPEPAGSSMQLVPAPGTTVTPRRSRKVMLAAAGVVAVGIVAFVVGRSGSHPEPTATDPTSNAVAVAPPPPPGTPAASRLPTPTAEPTAPPVADPLIAVSITAHPTVATITIDGAQVPSNPFQGKYRGDGAMHRVHVSAPGFTAVTKDVAFDANLTLDLTLATVPKPPVIGARGKRGGAKLTPTEPAVATPPPVTAPVVKPTPKPDAGVINPQGGSKPLRPIDSKNPYATPGTP